MATQCTFTRVLKRETDRVSAARQQKQADVVGIYLVIVPNRQTGLLVCGDEGRIFKIREADALFTSCYWALDRFKDVSTQECSPDQQVCMIYMQLARQTRKRLNLETALKSRSEDQY